MNPPTLALRPRRIVQQLLHIRHTGPAQKLPDVTVEVREAEAARVPSAVDAMLHTTSATRLLLPVARSPAAATAFATGPAGP
ncbi:hypothetical protein ACFVYR_37590 [Streptomyces sp. NPDC058284]|uniref:hypothetical protein n=1 Tax=unclassified Streptomyces TaxID=2593676 RepID=UPI00364C15B7